MSNDECYSVHFRPRYSEEESSDDAYEKDNRHRRFENRKRKIFTVLLMIAFMCAVGIVTRVYLFFTGNMRNNDHITGSDKISFNTNNNETQSTFEWGPWKKKSKAGKRSMVDSYGFFNEIPDDEWKQIKLQTMDIINIQDGVTGRTSYLLSESGANIDSGNWWKDNWKMNFMCQNKVYLGGKWVCDPKRMIAIVDEKIKSNKPNKSLIKKKDIPPKECLIYISGGSEIEFSHQFLDYSLARMIELNNDQAGNDLLACEVHIFAPHGQDIQESREGIFIHNWGFRPTNKESMGMAATFKTLEQTIAELQHSGRISMLVLDCEACEWDMYTDILSLEEPIQQVLMQMHGTPFMANELFLAMQEAGYVIYHREENGYGEVFDYSWIKLAPSFFVWKG